MRAFAGLPYALALAMAATLVAPAAIARAADWYTGGPSDGPTPSRAPRIAIDISFDATSQRAISGALIGTIAPFAPMDRSGMRLRVGALAGTYVYTAVNPFPFTPWNPSVYPAWSPYQAQINGTFINGSVLMGYEWVTTRATVGVYAGAEAVSNSISPNDPNNTAKGSRVGFKVATDFYVTPTDDMMIAGVASYSTNFNSYYGRLKFGFAVAERLYIGPEVAALGDNFFQQWRIGGHVSGLRFGMMQFGAAVGYLNDRVRGGGVYGTLDTRLTF